MVHNQIEASRKAKRIATISQEVKICDNILNILDQCKEIIQAYNGKVVNRRMIVSLNEIGNNPQKIQFTYGCRPGWSEEAIKISDFNNRSCKVGDQWVYLATYEEYIPIVTDSPENQSGQPRLNAEKTIENLETLRTNLYNQITELQSDIENYDKEVEAWQTIKAMVEDYQNTFSYRLRGDITMRR